MVMRIMTAAMLFVLLMQPAMSEVTASYFQASVSNSSIELGKGVYLELKGAGADGDNASLANVDLSGLEKDFAINHVSDVETNTLTRVQTIRIRLYPRQMGKLTIPELTFSGIRSQPIVVKVLPAIDPKNGSKITVVSSISHTSAWIRQAIEVRMEFQTQASIIALDSDVISHSALRIVSQPIERRHDKNEKPLTRHQTGWTIYPQTSGALGFQLPPIKYIRDGVPTHLFYPPKLQLTVNSLPGYIPATMPVAHSGPVLVAPTNAFLVKGKLAYLTIRFDPESQSQFPVAITRQLKSNQAIRFYPADKRDEYRIPFSIKKSGWYALPAIKIQYFNPRQGKIVTQYYRGDRFIVLAQWMVYVIYSVLVLIAAWLLNFLYQQLRKLMYVFSCYLHAVELVGSANSASQCKSALMVVANAESWPANLTLLHWQQLWLQKFQKLATVTEHITLLEQTLYSNNKRDIRKISNGLLAVFYQRLPLLRILTRLKGYQ